MNADSSETKLMWLRRTYLEPFHCGHFWDISCLLNIYFSSGHRIELRMIGNLVQLLCCTQTLMCLDSESALLQHTCAYHKPKLHNAIFCNVVLHQFFFMYAWACKAVQIRVRKYPSFDLASLLLSRSIEGKPSPARVALGRGH